MCGQVGLILGRKRRTRHDLQELRDIFVALLLHSEVRGPHATGMAWLKVDGSHRLAKAPVPAHEWVASPTFQQALAAVDSRTTLLMGHTRWSTRGDPANNRNNHPLHTGVVLGTHNGTIYNAEQLFRKLSLPRYAEVDSEVLFRLADRHTPEDAIDPIGFTAALRWCRGQISAVLASTLDPATILVLKGNKPLHLWFNRQRRVVAYASETRFLEAALALDEGADWRCLKVPRMTLLTLSHDGAWHTALRPLDFIAQERPGTLPAGVVA
jgi:amidophosphoribosyltransferase